MKKATFVLILLTIGSKILGFGREIVLAYYYGASNISDAYLIALTIPITVFAFVGAGISSSYIPVYSQIEHYESTVKADYFTSQLIKFVLIIATVLVMLVLIFTAQFVKFFASGFDGDTLLLTIRFTRISIFGIFFSGMTYVLSGYLNIKNDFITPALMGLPFNFFVMLSIVVSYQLDVMWLAYGIVIAMIFQWLLLLPAIYKKNFHYCFKLGQEKVHLKKMLFLSMPVIVGSSINQINILVDRTLASKLSVGGIAALNYANRLNDFVIGIFVMTFVTVIYPSISKMAVKKDIEALKNTLIYSVNIINILLVPVIIGTILLSKPIVEVLFQRGAFKEQAVIMTSQALSFYAIGMIGIAYREVLSRVFYALEDTRKPMLNAGITFLLNIILNIIFSMAMGISGLALATSISAIVCSVLLAVDLHKKIALSNVRKVLMTFMKVIVASLIMGLVVKGTFKICIFKINMYLSLFITIIVGISIYLGTLFFIKAKEINDFISFIKSKIESLKL